MSRRADAASAVARIVVIGEFNSGKTSLVNALLGAPVLPASFTAHTACPAVVRYAAKPSLAAETADRRHVPIGWDQIDAASAPHVRRLHVGMPLERLKALRLVDTPGLGLERGDGEAAALAACRSADRVIWCTPAMQAWKASEERAWLSLPGRVRQRGVLAVTFMDTVGSDAARVLARLEAEAGSHFGRIVAAQPRAALLAVLGVRTAAGPAAAEPVEDTLEPARWLQAII